MDITVYNVANNFGGVRYSFVGARAGSRVAGTLTVPDDAFLAKNAMRNVRLFLLRPSVEPGANMVRFYDMEAHQAVAAGRAGTLGLAWREKEE